MFVCVWTDIVAVVVVLVVVVGEVMLLLLKRLCTEADESDHDILLHVLNANCRLICFDYISY